MLWIKGYFSVSLSICLMRLRESNTVTSMILSLILAHKLESAMKEKKVTVSALARKMGTSRAAINRILDSQNPSAILTTLGKAAFALGKRWRFELVDA